MRKHFFNHLESGYFKKEQRNAASPLSAMGGRHMTIVVYRKEVIYPAVLFIALTLLLQILYTTICTYALLP